MSLRRYAPQTFGELSFTRMLSDLALTMAGFMIVSDYGIDSGLENTVPIRRDLVLKGK